MSLADYSVVAAYLLVAVFVGLRARRSVSSSDDFFLARGGLPLWLTSLSFMAANLGSFELMGFAATAARYGMPSSRTTLVTPARAWNSFWIKRLKPTRNSLTAREPNRCVQAASAF